jgi:Region found in RelA / SpoT proteins
MARVEPQYDRETVNRAGLVLRTVEREKRPLQGNRAIEYHSAVDIVNNWRSSHAYPLNAIQSTLRSTCRTHGGGKFLIARRIKRLSSIAHKLDRFDTMRLSQMQDLGGCRGILPVAGDVQVVAAHYQHGSRQKHEIATVDDYLAQPRKSGYRGIHLVFRYHSEVKANAPYSGLKIEMQLRSRYQHAWATAVETVGMFSGQALKSSLGSEEWQRFFSLMGSALAMREKMPLVPGTPPLRPRLLSELAGLADHLHVTDRLRGYRDAVKALLREAQSNASLYLLELDTADQTLTVTGYRNENLAEATKRYAEIEAKAEESLNGNVDAVLVSVESVTNLARAYPNYFADTRVFIQLMHQAISGHSRGIRVPADIQLGDARQTPPVSVAQPRQPSLPLNFPEEPTAQVAKKPRRRA